MEISKCKLVEVFHVKFYQNCGWFMCSVRKFTCHITSNNFTNNQYTNRKSEFFQENFVPFFNVIFKNGLSISSEILVSQMDGQT